MPGSILCLAFGTQCMQAPLLCFGIVEGSLLLWPWAGLPIGFESVKVAAAEPAWQISGPHTPNALKVLLLLFSVQRGVLTLSG